MKINLKDTIETERDKYIENIFKTVAPYIDYLSMIFSFGLAYYWRKRLVSLLDIKPGDRILDLCTGTGSVALLLAEKAGNNVSITGVDFCERMIEIARRKANQGRKKISFILGNAKNLDFPDGYFDAVTVAFGIRNIDEPERALKEVYRVLKRNVPLLCLELMMPQRCVLSRLYNLYLFHVIPFVGRIVTKDEIPYRYLPQSIDNFLKPEEFKRLLEISGFKDIHIYPLTLGIANIFKAQKR